VTAQPRVVTAGNAGPLTLDGTRTYLVGDRIVAVIDAGPALDSHLVALRQAVAGANEIALVVTHGHSDHAPAARLLATEMDTDLWGPAGVEGVTRPLRDGDRVPTDAGELIAIDTPGHARHHLGFHWPEGRAFFAGDLLLGSGDTVWVGEYPGCVADYLASLERVRALGVDVIHAGHGPAIEAPEQTLDRYVAHRQGRIAQMAVLLAERPGASAEELAREIYGASLPEGLRRAVERSVEAHMTHVRAHGAEGRG
jgi:glyoxylase-like metal-dependent hydrolase (beta-lactamase superfamily II)